MSTPLKKNQPAEEQPQKTVTLTIDEKTYEAFLLLAENLCKNNKENNPDLKANDLMRSVLAYSASAVRKMAEAGPDSYLELRINAVDIVEEAEEREQQQWYRPHTTLTR